MCLLPDTFSNQPGQQLGKPAYAAASPASAIPIWFCSRWGLPCRPCCQGRGALLPHPFTLTCKQVVCFLWHFPWGRPRRPLTGTAFPWSPDFPLPRRAAIIQPSGPPDYAPVRPGSSFLRILQGQSPQILFFPCSPLPVDPVPSAAEKPEEHHQNRCFQDHIQGT